MHKKLQSIADLLLMRWGFGELKDLDDLAESVVLFNEFILFSEGYLFADLNLDAQRALEYRYNLRLDICLRSDLAEKPNERESRIDQLNEQLKKVLWHLTKLGKVSGMKIATGINRTTSNLDVLQFTCVLEPDAVSICQR